MKDGPLSLGCHVIELLLAAYLLNFKLVSILQLLSERETSRSFFINNRHTSLALLVTQFLNIRVGSMALLRNSFSVTKS